MSSQNTNNTPEDKQAEQTTNPPPSLWRFFIDITIMAMQAYGGSVAIAQQFFVEQKKWLTRENFLDLLTTAQSMPGPGVMIMCLMLGDRFYGFKGAVTAFFGMLTLPVTLLLTSYSIYHSNSDVEWVRSCLLGMSASASGMVVGTALKLCYDMNLNPIGKAAWLILLVTCFVMVAVFKLSMLYVLPMLGIPAVWWCHRSILRIRAEEEAKA